MTQVHIPVDGQHHDNVNLLGYQGIQGHVEVKVVEVEVEVGEAMQVGVANHGGSLACCRGPALHGDGC
jgi:hypothetical protein